MPLEPTESLRWGRDPAGIAVSPDDKLWAALLPHAVIVLQPHFAAVTRPIRLDFDGHAPDPGDWPQAVWVGPRQLVVYWSATDHPGIRRAFHCNLDALTFREDGGEDGSGNWYAETRWLPAWEGFRDLVGPLGGDVCLVSATDGGLHRCDPEQAGGPQRTRQTGRVDVRAIRAERKFRLQGRLFIAEGQSNVHVFEWAQEAKIVGQTERGWQTAGLIRQGLVQYGRWGYRVVNRSRVVWERGPMAKKVSPPVVDPRQRWFWIPVQADGITALECIDARGRLEPLWTQYEAGIHTRFRVTPSGDLLYSRGPNGLSIWNSWHGRIIFSEGTREG